MTIQSPMGLLGTIKGHTWHTEPKGAIEGHNEPFGAIRDHKRPYRAIQDHMGQFVAIWCPTGPYRGMQGHMGPKGALRPILDHTELYGPYMAI